MRDGVIFTVFYPSELNFLIQATLDSVFAVFSLHSHQWFHLFIENPLFFLSWCFVIAHWGFLMLFVLGNSSSPHLMRLVGWRVGRFGETTENLRPR